MLAMKKSTALKRSARVEIAGNLELAVVVDDKRLCARISPSTARQLAGVLLQLAGSPRASRRPSEALVA